VTHAKHAGYASPGGSEFPFFAGKKLLALIPRKRERERERERERDQCYVFDRCTAMHIASASVRIRVGVLCLSGDFSGDFPVSREFSHEFFPSRTL